MWSIIENNMEALRVLIDGGANLDIAFEMRDKDRYIKNSTALVCCIIDDDVNAVRMIVNAGADVNTKVQLNGIDYTVLEFAKEIGNNNIILKTVGLYEKIDDMEYQGEKVSAIEYVYVFKQKMIDKYLLKE